jgi:hypothetical protein
VEGHEGNRRGSAFLKGAGGCFGVFAILAVIAVAAGGSAYIDAGGVVLLFVIGGVIGLVVNAIYQKGRKDIRRGR